MTEGRSGNQAQPADTGGSDGPDTVPAAAGEADAAAEKAAQEALRHARETEAEWLDARLKVRDAATLRLFTIQQELRPFVAAMPEARGIVDLALSHGWPPRLWLDLSAYILVDDDGRTLKLVQETLETRDVIFSTRSVDDMVAFARRFIAHRVVRRHRVLADTEHLAEMPAMPEETRREGEERKAATAMPAEPRGGGEGWSLWIVWLAGVVTGMMLLAAYLSLKGVSLPFWP